MPAHLLIHDGDSPYWWESPDIWVVPGTDPNGAPGSPIAGLPAFLWARVSNTGNTTANGTRVDFYWANPSAQIAVGTATPVGSAFVDLGPGQTQEVLCLVPWVPVIVNGGHECLIAVVHGAGDTNPLPDPLPNGYVLDPPAHEQIAQLNVSVLEAESYGAPMAIFVNSSRRTDKVAHLSTEYGQAPDPRVLSQLGLHGLRLSGKNLLDLHLSLQPRCSNEGEGKETRELEVRAQRGTSVPVFVSLRASRLHKDHYQMVRVVERVNDKIVGGVSYVIAGSSDRQGEKS